MPRPKTARASPRPSPTLRVRIECNKKGCGAVGALRFDGGEPFWGFKPERKGWFLMEDDDGTVTYLCPRCSAPVRKDLKDDDARSEQMAAPTLVPVAAWKGDEGDSEEPFP